MRFIVGSDDAVPVLERVAELLRGHGHEVIAVVVKPWGEVALEVAHAVASKSADQGIVMCWTGTGVSMAASKVAGVRAALCVDAADGRGRAQVERRERPRDELAAPLRAARRRDPRGLARRELRRHREREPRANAPGKRARGPGLKALLGAWAPR